MRPIFADTCYWVALINRRDGLHALAQRFSSSSITEQVVTSELVLVEFLNGVSSGGAFFRSSATQVVADLRANSRVTICSLTSFSFAEISGLYRERTDKSWSFTDCSSFLIMHQLGIDAALTEDKHFEQAGFRALLRL